MSHVNPSPCKDGSGLFFFPPLLFPCFYSLRSSPRRKRGTVLAVRDLVKSKKMLHNRGFSLSLFFFPLLSPPRVPPPFFFFFVGYQQQDRGPIRSNPKCLDGCDSGWTLPFPSLFLPPFPTSSPLPLLHGCSGFFPLPPPSGSPLSSPHPPLDAVKLIKERQ